MGATYTWRALPLDPSAGIPVLLASIHVGTAAYTVRVTDMANIWAESLERRQICMRAWGENTSIDPSDTPENMMKFLDSLRSALDPSHQDHPQTSMSLSPAASSSDDRDCLTLNITCELPGMSPLKWPVQLKKQSSSSLALDLVVPLIQGQYERARESQVLAEMLSSKDAIITKLIDKLESTGTGLEHVFNSLSSKKKVSRAAAETKVKGLAPFDKKSWQGNSINSHQQPESFNSLINKVFGGDGLALGLAIQDEGTADLDTWWHGLKETVQIPHRSQPSKAGQGEDNTTQTSNTEVDDEDDFHFQPSSPAAPTSKKATKMQEMDDMSTASESGEDGIDDEPRATKPAAQPTGGRTGRIGAIGSRKQTDEQTSPPSLTVGNDEAVKEADGSETATDASDQEGAPEPTKLSPAQARSGVPSRGKIGRIGGRGATSVSETESSVPRQLSEDTSNVSRPSHPSKLGMIGKGAKAKDENEERGRQIQTTEPGPRETSTERADRRREELKRELEKKAAAGPTKKKRKF